MTNPVSPTGPLGLIVPPAKGEVPSDAGILYPGTEFIARGLALPTVTPAGYDQVIDAVVRVARELAEAGAVAISLMGTSLSFYRGVDFNQELQRSMAEASGRPCTTMSQAVLRGLETLGLRRVVVATAYIDDVNQRLATFLRDSGYAVDRAEGLEMTDIAAIQAVDTETLVALCERVWRSSPEAEGIVLSCGGLKTLDTIVEVERRLGVPVVSSPPAGVWDLMRTAGRDARVEGRGALLGRA